MGSSPTRSKEQRDQGQTSADTTQHIARKHATADHPVLGQLVWEERPSLNSILAAAHERTKPRPPTKLLWLMDELSGQPYLVDSGAFTSVLLRSRVLMHHLEPTVTSLFKCYGMRLTSMKFQGCHFMWDYKVPKINKGILGADFLSANNLCVNVAQCIITSNADSDLILPGNLNSDSININHILAAFRVVCGPENFENPPPPKRIYHSIETTISAPLYSKCDPLKKEKLTAIKEAFVEMESQGVIHAQEKRVVETLQRLLPCQQHDCAPIHAEFLVQTFS